MIPKIKSIEQGQDDLQAQIKSLEQANKDLQSKMKYFDQGQGDIKASVSDLDKFTSSLEEELKHLENKLAEWFEGARQNVDDDADMKHAVGHLQNSVRDIEIRMQSLQIMIMTPAEDPGAARGATGVGVDRQGFPGTGAERPADEGQGHSKSYLYDGESLGEHRRSPIESQSGSSISGKSPSDVSKSKLSKRQKSSARSDDEVNSGRRSSRDENVVGKRLSDVEICEKAVAQLDGFQAKIKYLVQDTNLQISGVKDRLNGVEAELETLVRQSAHRDSAASIRAISSTHTNSMNRVSLSPNRNYMN